MNNSMGPRWQTCLSALGRWFYSEVVFVRRNTYEASVIEELMLLCLFTVWSLLKALLLTFFTAHTRAHTHRHTQTHTDTHTQTTHTHTQTHTHTMRYNQDYQWLMLLWVNSVIWFCFEEKCILHHKYSRHLHKTNINVFTILSTIKLAKFHLFSDITAD